MKKSVKLGCSNRSSNAYSRRICRRDQQMRMEDTTVKAGFIFLHDENSTYDLNFINAAKEACEKMGIEYVFKTGIPGGSGVHMRQPASLQMQAATSYLQTASAMRITSLRQQESSRMFSSAMRPEQRHIRRSWTTSTMHLLLFMRDVTWLVLLLA